MAFPQVTKLIKFLQVIFVSLLCVSVYIIYIYIMNTTYYCYSNIKNMFTPTMDINLVFNCTYNTVYYRIGCIAGFGNHV
jgi:hypothetical protein